MNRVTIGQPDSRSVKACPVCDLRAESIDSRSSENGWRRRYQCVKCNLRWTTLEQIVLLPDGVKDGRGYDMETHLLIQERARAVEQVREVINAALDGMRGGGTLQPLAGRGEAP